LFCFLIYQFNLSKEASSEKENKLVEVK